MLLRTFPFAAAFLSLVIGCAAPNEAQDDAFESSSEAALTSTSLRAMTALDRMRTLEGEAGSLAVDYAPGADASGYERRVAFEAVSFDAAASTTEVTVAGDFPSSALVVVANERFEPLAATRTVRTANGVAEAALRVPSGDGQRFILVRDPKWVRPMTFEVHVGPR